VGGGDTLNLGGRGGTVTADSLRPPRPTPVGPACSVFMGPCTLAGSPRRHPWRRSAPPLDDTPSGARVTAAPEGGGAIPGAPAARPIWPTPATPFPCTLAGAPRRAGGVAPCPPPLDNSFSGARVTAAPEGGRGAPYPALPPLERLVWPTSATQAPLTRPCVPRTAPARAPLAPAGPPRSGAATAGADRDSTRAPHWGDAG